MTTLTKVAADLYASLKMMPCRCQVKWQASKQMVTDNCSRCRALAAYEKLFPPSSEADASATSLAETQSQEQARADL